MPFGLTPEAIIQYINYAFIGILLLKALIGFFRGTRKSVYYLIATAIVYVGGFLLMNKLVDLIMNIDISKYYALSFAIEGHTYNVTTINAFIYELLTQTVFAGADLTNTITVSLITGVVQIVVRLVYFIILIILADTVLKILFDIIWLFVRPKKVENEKGKLKRPKPKFLSRLGGFGIGGAKAVFIMLIVFFLVAGIASVTVDVSETLELAEENSKYDVILLGNSITLVEETTQEKGFTDQVKEDYADYLPYLEVLTGYRTGTIAGKIYGSIKIGDACFDEWVFDQFFRVNIDVEDGDYKFNSSIVIRDELHKLALAFQECSKEDPNFIDNVMKGDLSSLSKETLNKAIDILTDLELVRVVVPVGVEILFLTDTLTKDNETLKGITEKFDYNELREITSDLGADFKNLGYTFVNVLDIMNGDISNIKDIDFLSFDPQMIKELFDQLAQVGLIDTFAPMVIEMLLDSESIKKAIESLELDYEEVKSSILSIDDWTGEVSKLGAIYSKVLELGITQAKIKEMDFASLDMTKIEDLVSTIFTSQIVNTALPILVKYGQNKLSESEDANKYLQYINITADTNWKEELTPLLQSVCVLMKNGFNSKESFSNFLVTLKNIPDSAFDEIGGYLSQSNLLKDALNGIIKEALSGGTIDFLKDVEIKGFTEEEMKAGTAWSAAEISGMFKAAKSLVGLFIGDDGKTKDINVALKSLDDPTIESLANNLSKSTFLKRNLSDILSAVLKNAMSGEGDLTLVVLTEAEWTKEELSAIFGSVVDLLDIGILDGDIQKSISELADEKIEDLASKLSGSKFLTKNFGNIIDFALSKVDLGFEVEGLEDDSIWNENEIIALLKSAKVLMGYTTGDKKLTDLLMLSDQTEVDNLMNSQVIAKSIGSFVKSSTKTDESGNPTGKYDLTIIKGVDKISDDGWGDKLTDVNPTVSYNGNIVTVENATNLINEANADRIDLYINGIWVGPLENGSYDLTTYLAAKGKTIDDVKSQISFKARTNGEVRKIFGALSKLAKDAFVNDNLDSDKLIKNITSLTDEDVDQVTASVIITETVKSYLADLGNDSGSGYGLVVKDIETIDINNELKALIKSVKLLFGDDIDITNLNFEVNEILSNIAKLTNDITKEPGDEDQVGIIISSKILRDTVAEFINKEAEKTDAIFVVPSDVVYNDYYEGDVKKSGELRALFASVSTLFPDGTVDMDNIKLNTLFNCSDEELDDFLASKILQATVKKIIIDLDDGTDDSTILVNQTAIEEKGWTAEIKSMIKAIKFVLGEDADLNNVTVDANSVLAANDSELDSILGSIIVTDTLIKVLYDQSNVTIKGVEKTGGNIIIPKDGSGNYYTLASSFWRDTYTGDVRTDGEVRKIFKGIQAMFTKLDPITGEEKIEVNFDNIDANIILDLTDSQIDALVASDVLEVTIKDKIVALDTGADDTTIIVNETAVNAKGWKNEIKSMIKAIKFVLGDDADFDSMNVDANKVLAASDSELDLMLGSIIVTDTLIKVLYDQSNVTYKGVEKSGGSIIIPKDGSGNYYTLESNFWRDTYTGDVRTDGEVRKIFKGIQTMFTKTDPATGEDKVEVDFNNISADAILDLTDAGIDTLLNSDVLAVTIRKNILELDTRSTTGSTTIYVNEANITKGGRTWNTEIKALLKAFKSLIEPDLQGHYSLENATDIDINAVLDPTNKTKFLSSMIISDTIIANLESNAMVYTRTGLDWYGTDGTNGELGKFIDAAALVLKNKSGEIDINNFSEDNLTKLTNDITKTPGDEDQVGVLLASTVLRDTMVSHIVDIDSINLTETNIEADNYWNDHAGVKGEIRSLLLSFNIILGDKEISTFEFDMDTLLSKTKIQIETAINGSDIISNTCATTISKVLYEDSLNGMIAEPSGTKTRMQYVKEDQVHLIWVFKDLKEQFNVSYSSFDYNSFSAAISTDADAYNMSDVIGQSTILIDSLSTMFGKMIGDNASLSTSVRGKITTNINSITDWTNPTVVGTTKTFGELALLLRAFSTLSTFGTSSATLSAATMKDPMEKLNASKALQPVVTEILEKALDSLGTWRKDNVELTTIEWNYEINLLVDLIQFVENDLGGNLNGVTNASSLSPANLENLITYISKSRILDITKINDIVQTAVDGIFGNDTFVNGDEVAPAYSSSATGVMNVTMNNNETSATMNITGYTNSAYDTFVTNWGVEATGIATAIDKLNKVDFTLLTQVLDFNTYEFVDTGHTETKFKHGMRLIGIFLDACENTNTLVNTVEGIANTYSVSKGSYTTWEEAFVA